jgi:hypothetical protein
MSVKKVKKSVFDPKSLTDEQIAGVFGDERIWKHPRFKELTEKAKKAEELSKKEEEAIKAKLEEEKKFKELLDLEKQKVDALEKQLSRSKVDSAITTEAVKAGFENPEDALRLIDREAVQAGEEGTPLGIAEAIKALAENKPYLVGKTNLGSGTPANQPPVKIKLSDAQNPEFYQKHEKEVDEAFKSGNIEIDVPVGGVTPQN